MRIFICAISFFLIFHTYAQNQKAVSWINENAIKIEDANPDTNLTIFYNNIPPKFAAAKFSDSEKLLIKEKNFSI